MESPLGEFARYGVDGLRMVLANLSCPERINTAAYGKPDKFNEASLHAYNLSEIPPYRGIT